MKRQVNIPFICALFSAALFSACDDGSSAPEEPVDTFDAAVVCPADGMNAYGEPNRGTFTDARDGQVYKYTTIGNQVWMAENLKFDAPYSVCYDKIDGFCDTFGRFYSLHVNGEELGMFDQELLDPICPARWRVPSVNDWNILANIMGGGLNAAARLSSPEKYGEYYVSGTDECAFNSLPVESLLLDGSLGGGFNSAVYWTSTAESMNFSYECIIDRAGVRMAENYPKQVIRCVRN